MLATALAAGSCESAEHQEQAESLSNRPARECQYSLPVPSNGYFALVPFALSAGGELNVAYDIPSSVEDDYVAALNRVKRSGINALSEEQLRLPLMVSWFGYTMQTWNEKYEILEENASSRQRSSVVVESAYRFELIGDSPASLLVTRHWTERRGTEQVAGVPADVDEMLDFYEVTHPGTSDEQIILTRWQRRGDGWHCQRGEAGAEYWYWFMSRRFPATAFIQGKPLETEMICGRTTYKIEAHTDAPDPVQWLGRPLWSWVDTETLVPIRQEYQSEQAVIRRIDVLDINGTTDIRAPTADVVCEQESFDP